MICVPGGDLDVACFFFSKKELVSVCKGLSDCLWKSGLVFDVHLRSFTVLWLLVSDWIAFGNCVGVTCLT
jgi:hypothetical protein